jgi:uncharacterized protein involved in response to NO
MAAVRQLPVIQSPGGQPGTHTVPTTIARPAPADLAEDAPDWGATRCLIVATATAGLLGVPLGLHLAWWTLTGKMGEVPWLGWVQAHGQMQLFGWLGLAILGVTFHAMAHLFGTAETPNRLAWTVLGLQMGGVALRFLAPLVARGVTALAPWNGGAWLLVGSALAFLGAFCVTLEAHIRTLPRRGREGRGPAVLPRYLLAGLLLWFASLLVNLDGAIDALRFGPPAAGAISAGRDAFVVAAAAGGFALVALGMSLRVAAGWADLPRPDLARAAAAWPALALGALLRALGVAADAGSWGIWLEGTAALLWAAGVAWYLPVLRGLWSRDVATPGGGARGEADPPLTWFIRTAYAWLAVSAVLGLLEVAALLTGGIGTLGHAQLADAGRHALLFGFLGVLTAGLTGRLPTAFLDLGEAGIAATRGLYRATFALLLPATVLRAVAPLLGDLRSATIALSGAFGTVALCCLLGVLARIAWMRRNASRTVEA